MNQRDKVISIARTELGYAEESSGWTKYGQWYADNVAHNQSFATADWCNMFVTWVMRQANVTADVYPDTSPQGSACLLYTSCTNFPQTFLKEVKYEQFKRAGIPSPQAE